ncbi:MarR family transcriptional regulator [Streptomyces sp. A7024]|uniref:MarR family transcriptional regulator n=1 Tax=Streptomyces coryli TaxID=1128680 RepID=A0A6G4U712_9ACTN|nr:MarR family transcriptional regulator [Streptomyces coryli]NGN67178.1 MarR family transcriptional regulator [Streptomyces coryli]
MATTAVATDQAAWHRLISLHATVEHQLAQSLQRRHGLGLSEYRALAELTTAPDGERRMQDLATRIGLNQSSVTRLIARLESAGFAYKDLCPDDKRGVYAVITEDGRKRQSEAAATYGTTLSESLTAAAKGDPRVAGLVDGLRGA